MARHPTAEAAAVIHDLTLEGPLSVVLKIFSEIKHVLKEDAGLELAVSKTQILSNAPRRYPEKWFLILDLECVKLCSK